MDISNQSTIQTVLGLLNDKSTTLGALDLVCQIPEISFASFILLKYKGAKQTHRFVRTNYPANWVSHYLQNGYLEIDPILSHARNSSEPFFWDQAEFTGPSIEILNSLDNYGILPVGYVTSIQDRHGNHSVLSLNSVVDQREWHEFVHFYRNELESISRKIHNTCLSEQQNPEVNRFIKLTKREVEILYWAAEGKSHFEISKILGVSENTVHGYAKSARLKLDSVTVAQAVARAVRAGLI